MPTPLKSRFAGQQPTCPAVPGFTILELLTVMAVIAFLAAMTYPIMGWVQDKQRIIRAKSEVEALGQALDRYRVANGTYPIFDPGSNDLSPFQDKDGRNQSFKVEKQSSEALFLALTGWNNWKCEEIPSLEYDQRERFIELENYSFWSDAGRKGVRDFLEDAAAKDPRRPVDIYLADPWRQPYLYKFPILSTEGDYSDIPKFFRREDFVLLSKGPDEELNSKANPMYGLDSWLKDEDAGLDPSDAGDNPNLDNISIVMTPPM